MSGREPPSPSQWEEADLWLAKAAEDIAAARLLVLGEIASPASFHVQQEVPRTHDLDELSLVANRFWPTVIPLEFPLALVGRWYLPSRYPDADEAPPSLAEIADASADIERLAVIRAKIQP